MIRCDVIMKKSNMPLQNFFKAFKFKARAANTNKNTTEFLSGRELPGFRKKSFVLHFGGGEIWFEHMDGIYQYTELAIEKLCADSDFFSVRQHRHILHLCLMKRLLPMS